jgi:hypothetical protein
MNMTGLVFIGLGALLFILGIVTLLSDTSPVIYTGGLIGGPIMAFRGLFACMRGND